MTTRQPPANDRRDGVSPPPPWPKGDDQAAGQGPELILVCLFCGGVALLHGR